MSYLDELGLQSYDLLIKNYINSKAGGKFTEVVTVSGTLVILEIQPNIIYSFGTVESLTIALGTPGEGSSDYAFEFTSGNNATNLVIPSSIQWDDLISINPNKYYIVLIHYSNSSYHGTIKEWDVTNVDNRVTCVYVGSESSYTQLCYMYKSSSTNLSYVKDERDDYIAKMWVDGRLLDHPCPYYYFEDGDRHIVQFEFINPKVIPSYAFNNITSLMEIDFPDSVENIKNTAFTSSNLLKISGGSNIKYIYDNDGDSSSNLPLYNITLYEGTYIYLGRYFLGVKGSIPANTSYTMTEGSIIKANAFENQTNLVSIEIKDCKVQANAFTGCTGLTSIKLLGNSELAASVFSSSNLSSLEIDDTVKFKNSYAFSTLGNISYIKVNINDIETFASSNYASHNININSSFSKNVKLYQDDVEITEVTIPSGVTGVGTAFQRCYYLTSLTLPDTLTGIMQNAFRYCNFSSISIPSSVTSIGNYAFANNTGLTSVTTNSSDTNIGENAFSGCSNLSTVNIASSTYYIASSAFDGTAWYNNKSDGLVTIGTTVLKYKGTVPATLSLNSTSYRAIATSAFYNKTGITTLSLGSYVYVIGSNAFRGCTGITNTSLSLTNVKHIGSYAFNGITSLKTVTIGTSITTIGNYAFGGISNFTLIINKTTPPTLGSGVFNTSGLQIKVKSSYVDTYKTASGWSSYAPYIVSQ